MSAAARSCRAPPGLSSRSVCRALLRRARRRSRPKVLTRILRWRRTAALRFSRGRSILAPGRAPHSARLLRKSFHFRRSVSPLLKATPRSHPIRDRPEVQPVSWSAACRYDKRRQRRGHICCRSAPRGSIVRSPTSKHTTARSSSAAAASWPVLPRSSVARSSMCRSTNPCRCAIRILIRSSAPRIRARTFRQS